MKRFSRLLIVAAFACATLAATAGTAGAEASVGTYTLFCDSFVGSGTATTPWVTVEVWDNDAETDLVLELVAVNQDGTFSFDVSWTPPSSETADLYVSVWGSPDEVVGSWDEEDYFEADNLTCQPAPTTTTTAPTTTTTAGPAVEPAAAAQVTPAFTG